jgi:hypothetical protein
VSAVQRYDNVRSEPLRECRHRRVCAAEREVAVTLDEASDRRPVLDARRFDFDRGQATEKCRFGWRTKAAPD